MLKSFNLGISFLLELAVLAALSYFGFHLTTTVWLHWLAGIGLPLAMGIFWSQYMAPLAPKHFVGTPYAILKFIIFEAGALGLYASNQHTLGITLATASALNITIDLFYGSAI
jgi:hypothetical protein